MPLKCVKGIHSGTRITSFNELASVIDDYKETYWHEYSRGAIQWALESIFFGNKTFYQVRLRPGERKVLRERWTKV